MFSGIEFILGVVCSLMGIAVGYLLLVAVFTAIQMLSKHRLMKQKVEHQATALPSVGKTLDT